MQKLNAKNPVSLNTTNNHCIEVEKMEEEKRNTKHPHTLTAKSSVQYNYNQFLFSTHLVYSSTPLSYSLCVCFKMVY